MDEFNPSGSTRLRNACDTCHRLKRRCQGGMPCENCVSMGSSCFYSVAGRLGRPRGSRSRRNVDSMAASQTQTASSRTAQSHRGPKSHQDQPPTSSGGSAASVTSASSLSATSVASVPSTGMPDEWVQHHLERTNFNAFPSAKGPGADTDMVETDHVHMMHHEPEMFDTQSSHGPHMAFDNRLMLDPEFDTFDQSSFHKLPWMSQPLKSPDSSGMLHLYTPPLSDADAFQAFHHASTFDSSESSIMSQPLTNHTTPTALSPSPKSQLFPGNLQQQQQQQPPPPQQPQQQQPQPQQPEYPARPSSKPELLSQVYQQLQQNQEPTSSSNSPVPGCQCIPGLSSLLHDLKRAGEERLPLDDLLFRVSEALRQWAAFAACPRCQSSHDDDDEEDRRDDGETLLLATLSMRSVIAQISAAGFKGSGGGADATDDPSGAQLRVHVGSYEVTGSDRGMLMGVLRTITVRKLDAAVTTMRSLLRTKQARQNDTDTVMLHHIESLLDELASTIKRLQ